MEKKNQIPKYPHLRFPEFTDEWKEVKLGEVAHFSGGGTPSSEYSSYWEGTIPWISSSDIQNNNVTQINVTRFITKEALQHSSTKLCKAPCVLVVTRVGVGKVAYSDIDICTSQDFCILTDIQCEYHFLSYYLLTVMGKKVREVQGTSIKGITMQEVKSFHLCLPSLPEQRKIAALLSLIDERIEVQNAIIKEQEVAKTSLIRRLFDRTLRFPEFTDEWKVVRLGEVAEIIGGGTPSTTTTNYWNGGIVWFNPSEIGKKKYVSNSNRTISHQGLSNSGARLLPKGTVLLTTRATIGEIAIANVECTTNQGFQSVITGCEANNEYVYYFLSTQKEYLLRHSSGSTFRETPPSVIRNLPLRLPSLPEQRKIAALLSAVDERLAVEIAYVEQLKQQKTYLLRQMFI